MQERQLLIGELHVYCKSNDATIYYTTYLILLFQVTALADQYKCSDLAKFVRDLLYCVMGVDFLRECMAWKLSKPYAGVAKRLFGTSAVGKMLTGGSYYLYLSFLYITINHCTSFVDAVCSFITFRTIDPLRLHAVFAKACKRARDKRQN